MTAQPRPTDAEDDDRRHKALWLWLAIVAVLVAGLLTAIERLNGCDGTSCGPSSTHVGGAHDGPQSVTATNSSSGSVSDVSIEVSGSRPTKLAPGITRPVVLTVRNTGATPARITSASIRIGDASSGCNTGESMRVTNYISSAAGAAQYLIAPSQAVRIPLKISMLDLTTNQNACKNTRFPLTFQATAQRG